MAMKRALHLMEELGCGKVSSTHVEVTTGNSLEPKEMKVSIAKVNGVLGIEVPTEDIVRILTNLGFAPVVSGDELTLMIPAYREDMEDYPSRGLGDVYKRQIRMWPRRLSVCMAMTMSSLHSCLQHRLHSEDSTLDSRQSAR